MIWQIWIIKGGLKIKTATLVLERAKDTKIGNYGHRRQSDTGKINWFSENNASQSHSKIYSKMLYKIVPQLKR